MSNYTLLRADRATHLKIVAVSLIAGFLVISIGLAARPLGGDRTLRIEDNGIVLKAASPANWSSRQSATVR